MFIIRYDILNDMVVEWAVKWCVVGRLSDA
jgi:hypothetical protein